MKDNFIKNWEFVQIGKSVVMYGEIYNDFKHRFPDGASIRTSRILRCDFEEGKVETLNTIYYLDMGEKEQG